jgi:hypothetical protein
MSDYNIDKSDARIPLAETLQTLRHELQRAQLQSTGEGILFEIDNVELELQVVISRKARGEAGVEFWVVRAGGEIERSGETTHTIKLSLTPVSDKPGKVKVSNLQVEKPLDD